jgi:hypothetical protein
MKAQNSTQGFKDKVAELDKKETLDKNEETGFAAAYGTTPWNLWQIQQMIILNFP